MMPLVSPALKHEMECNFRMKQAIRKLLVMDIKNKLSHFGIAIPPYLYVYNAKNFFPMTPLRNWQVIYAQKL